MWTPGHSISISSSTVYEYIHLQNKLRVLLCPVPGAKVCAYMRAVNAGSKDEDACVPSGAAHFIEHMSFRIQNGKIWSLASKGDVINAETNLDSTRFYVVHLPHQTEETIQIDANRFGEKAVPADKVSVERHAVINELERGQQAGNQMFRTTSAVAILEHPYGKSTIGTRSDVDNTTAIDMEHFRSKFYVPNNTTLIFCGNFEPQRVLATVNTHFGQMPMGQSCHPVHSPEPIQLGTRTVNLNINAPCPMVCMAFHQPRGSTRESLVLQCIAKLTWNNNEGRAKQLVTENVLHDVSTYAPRQLEPYLWFFHGTMEQNTPETEQKMLKVLQSFVSRPPSAAELDNVKNALHDEWNRSTESVTDIMNELGRGVSIGNWKDFEDRRHALDTITPNDIASVAKVVFNTQNVTITRVIPTKTQLPTLETSVFESENSAAPTVNKLSLKQQQEDWSVESISPAMNVLHVPRAMYVRTTLSTRFSPAQHDIASLFVSNLGAECNSNGQTNTSRLTALHSERNFSHDHEFVHMTMAMPTSSTVIKQASDIVFNNEWSNPTFDEESVELHKRHMIAEMHSMHADQQYQVKSTFIKSLFEQTMYNVPIEHRIRRLQLLTASDLKKFHSDWFLNDNTYVTIVAPTNKSALAVQESFPSHSETPSTTLSWVSKPRQSVEHNLVLPGYGSFQIMLGQTINVKTGQPAEVALLCAAEILGGGMTGRLMHTVREQRGLGTYGLYAAIQTVSAQTEHIFCINGTFSPSSVKEGMACTRELLSNWHANGVTSQELSDAQDKMIGSRLIASDTVDNLHSMVVKQLLQNKKPKEEFQLFEKRVRALTLTEVNTAIQKYIDPSLMTAVIVGPTK